MKYLFQMNKNCIHQKIDILKKGIGTEYIHQANPELRLVYFINDYVEMLVRKIYI